MRRATYTPDCSNLDSREIIRSLPSPRQPVFFHRDHGMTGQGPGPYSGPRRRVFTLGVGGPVGSGKTALVERLCREFWPSAKLDVMTNYIDTHEHHHIRSRR